MMARTWALAWSGFLQLVRSRVYLNILVAGLGLIAASFAFEELTVDASGRVLFNVGTAFISLVVAALAGVVAITAVTRELETKQAHLVLARPLSRAEYVIARFGTAAMLVIAAQATLGLSLSALLAARGSENAALALAACLFNSFEGLVVAAIAIFFGVGSSSTMSAVFTTTIFLLGRLTGEMQWLLDKNAFGHLAPVVRTINAVLPHLPAFDITGLAYGGGSTAEVVQAGAYGAAYAAAFVAAATFRFSGRDLL